MTATLNFGQGILSSRTAPPSSEYLTEQAVRTCATAASAAGSISLPSNGATTGPTHRQATSGTPAWTSRLSYDVASRASVYAEDPGGDFVAATSGFGAIRQPAVGVDPSADHASYALLAEVFEAPEDPDAAEGTYPLVGDVDTVSVAQSYPMVAAVVSASPATGLTAVPARADTVVRRPTLGLVGYEDRFCTIEMYAKSLEGGEGEYIPLFNSTYASSRHQINSNFLINQINLNSQEAVQIVRTFGDYYLSDVGENPTTLEVQGVLFEAKNFPWLTEWRANYDRYLRARQCILRKAMVYLTVDDTMYSGYIIASNVSRNVSPAWELVPFGFTMVLRNAVDLRANALFPDVPASAMRDVVNSRSGLLEGNIGDPDASTLAQVAEIVAGSFDEGNQLLQVENLEFEGNVDAAVLRVNINHLVEVARQINAARGTDLIDLQGLRNGYLAQRYDEFASVGVSHPEVLQLLGFPSKYEMAVSSRRARVQEEYRAGLEAGVNAAVKGLSKWGVL